MFRFISVLQFAQVDRSEYLAGIQKNVVLVDAGFAPPRGTILDLILLGPRDRRCSQTMHAKHHSDISSVYQSHCDRFEHTPSTVQQRSWWFLAQFAGRIVSKKYLCLVIGDVGLPGYTDDISLPLQVWSSRVRFVLTSKMVFAVYRV